MDEIFSQASVQLTSSTESASVDAGGTIGSEPESLQEKQSRVAGAIKSIFDRRIFFDALSVKLTRIDVQRDLRRRGRQQLGEPIGSPPLGLTIHKPGNFLHR